MNRWAGKTAVITGASSGIGESIASELVKTGLQVVGLARRVDKMKQIAETLSSYPGKFHPIKTDITQEAEVLAAFEWTKSTLGGVDILINNAGIFRASSFCAGQTEDWRAVLDTNIMGLCIATRETILDLQKRDVEGHIININSICGHQIPGVVGSKLNMYAASKFALTALTQTLRQELLPQKKIRLSSISPGLVWTEMVQGPDRTIPPDMVYLNPVDISNAILYVLSTPQTVQITELIIQPLGEVL